MRRFALRMAPIAMLVGPVVFFDREYREAVYWLEWRAHTYEARSLAERIARDVTAGVDTGRLSSDIERFAASTADNPAQIANAESIRMAAKAGDLALVASLADRAIGQEDSLLPARSGNAKASLANARVWFSLLFVAGFLASVFQAAMEWVFRHVGPTPAEFAARIKSLERDLARARCQLFEESEVRKSLRSKAMLLEDRLQGKQFAAECREVIADIRQLVRGGGDEGGTADDQ